MSEQLAICNNESNSILGRLFSKRPNRRELEETISNLQRELANKEETINLITLSGALKLSERDALIESLQGELAKEKEISKAASSELKRGERRELPSRRKTLREKFKIRSKNLSDTVTLPLDSKGNPKIPNLYFDVGFYEDGTIGDLAIDCFKEGNAYRSMLNAFAKSISIGLQHGVPMDVYASAFTGLKFEPCGVVSDHPNLKMCSSVLDAIFRIIDYRYCGNKHAVQITDEDLIPTNLSKGSNNVK